MKSVARANLPNGVLAHENCRVSIVEQIAGERCGNSHKVRQLHN